MAMNSILGRPPIDFDDDEVICLGRELVAWLKQKYDNKENVLHLTEWYSIEKDLSYTQWKSLQKRIDFVPYYHSALEIMVMFTIGNKDLSPTYGNRFLGIYSKDIREHERAIKLESLEDVKNLEDHKAKIKNVEIETVSSNLVDLVEYAKSGLISQK